MSYNELVGSASSGLGWRRLNGNWLVNVLNLWMTLMDILNMWLLDVGDMWFSDVVNVLSWGFLVDDGVVWFMGVFNVGGSAVSWNAWVVATWMRRLILVNVFLVLVGNSGVLFLG